MLLSGCLHTAGAGTPWPGSWDVAAVAERTHGQEAGEVTSRGLSGAAGLTAQALGAKLGWTRVGFPPDPEASRMKRQRRRGARVMQAVRQKGPGSSLGFTTEDTHLSWWGKPSTAGCGEDRRRGGWMR